MNEKISPRVGFFVTCLVDLNRPSVGFAAIRLLQDSGCAVTVIEGQSCCGQPAYNSGELNLSRRLARQVIDACDGYDYIVLPSGSCAAMIRHHYSRLFQGDSLWLEKLSRIADRTHELTSFLVDVMDFGSAKANYLGTCTYHDSCSGLREMGVKQQPRQLLAGVRGIELKEMEEAEVCCGFGGTFCVKYPEISSRMASDKVQSIKDSGADTLIGGDLGCLMNIAGRLHRMGVDVRVFHVAELLTDEHRASAVCEPLSGGDH